MITLQLSFNLPFFAWRACETPKTPLQDPRRFFRSDAPLRQSRDVSFLDDSFPSGSHYIYESQISCNITGSDVWRWVAYFFVETYYDVESRETAQQHYDDSFPMDPLTNGTVAADMPLADPQAYFIVVFQIRLSQVKCEWEKIVDKIRQGVRSFEEVWSMAFRTLGRGLQFKHTQSRLTSLLVTSH